MCWCLDVLQNEVSDVLYQFNVTFIYIVSNYKTYIIVCLPEFSCKFTATGILKTVEFKQGNLRFEITL